MSISVVMPQLGESVVEGTITRWHVKPGDSITKDQPLVTVATDKADTDVPAPATGVVSQLLASEGQTVPTNSPIAVIEAGGAQPVAGARPAAQTAPAAPIANAPTTAAPGDAGPSTPRIRKLAKELGLDLDGFGQGSGDNGRITEEDLYARAKKPASSTPTETPRTSVPPQNPSVPPPMPGPTSTRPTTPIPPAQSAPSRAQSAATVAPTTGGAFTVRPYVPAPGDEVVPFNRRRRIIADHMVYSKRVAPHVYTFAEIDMHRVSRLRDARKGALKAEGVSLTFLAFIAAATARALRENAALNARVLDDAFVKLRAINLGVAVETPAGLIVPVVRNADELTVKGIARAIDDLALKAREGRIEADDLSGSTFSISNPGLKGNFVGAAVISQPNVGILRTGEIVKRPVVVEVDGVDTIAIHPVMFVALSYDHRIVDGVAANNFLHRVTELLEAGDFEV